MMSESRDILRPTTLGERGHAFWLAMRGPAEDNPVRIALLVEAARQLDLLERLDLVINGDDEFLVREVANGGEIIVKVDNAVGHRRMAAAQFQRMATELGSAGAAKSPENAAPADDGKTAAPDLADELDAARRKREAGWGV
jgi:hypothetical protein